MKAPDGRVYPQPPEDWIRTWQLTEVIGRGGTSVVYRLYDNEKVAVAKIFNPDSRFADIDRLRVRFRLEQWLSARLCPFPGIAAGGSFGEHDGQPYLLMPLYRSNLKREIRERKEQPTSASFARLAYELLDALTFLHANSIVHRDLKPDNVLIDDSDPQRYALADFGIGLLEDTDYTRQTVTGDLMGSRDYIAPEQRANPRDAEPISDIYSARIILYEFGTGRLPSGRHVRFATETPHLRWAAPIVESMISQEPKERPSSAPKAGRLLAEAALGAAHHITMPRRPFAVLVLLTSPFCDPDFRRTLGAPSEPLVFDDLLAYVSHALGEPYKRTVFAVPPQFGAPLQEPSSWHPFRSWLNIEAPPNAMELLREQANLLKQRYGPFIQNVTTQELEQFRYCWQ